jgi:hypothetical protein
VLELSDQCLEEKKRNAPEKVVLAWWLRKQTTVPLEWVSERLHMGHYTSVTQAVARCRNKPSRGLRALQAKVASIHRK